MTKFMPCSWFRRLNIVNMVNFFQINLFMHFNQNTEKVFLGNLTRRSKVHMEELRTVNSKDNSEEEG